MAILNEDLRFEDADPTVRRAFLGKPERIRLESHVRLYKWTNRPLSDGSRVSPWWAFLRSTRLPSGRIAGGFHLSQERAQRIGSSHREFARARAAISEQFGNTMTNLLVVQLNLPVWAFAGQASGQREFADTEVELRNVVLIGGACQVWLPNLTPRHVSEVSGAL